MVSEMDVTSDLLQDCRSLNTELPPLLLLDGEEVLNLDLSRQQATQTFVTSHENVSFPSITVKEETEDVQMSSAHEEHDLIVPNFELLNKKPDAVVRRQRSEEDEERARLRREKNRDAAARCRRRRKERAEHLRKKTTRLENSNSGLRAEIGRLQLEVRKLRTELARHMELCHSGELNSHEWTDGSEEI